MHVCNPDICFTVTVHVHRQEYSSFVIPLDPRGGCYLVFTPLNTSLTNYYIHTHRPAWGREKEKTVLALRIKVFKNLLSMYNER